MMTYEAAKQLFDGAGLPLTESHFAQFQCYLAELTETNRHMNLTAITEPAEAWEKHFLDCAILLQKVQLPLGATCIDVGTGAGFPGMVLALLRPDLQVTLLDSLQKRIGFLSRRRQSWDLPTSAVSTPEPRTGRSCRNCGSSLTWRLPEPWQPCRC